MKFIKRALLISLLLIIVLLLLNYNKVKRLHRVMNFFDKEMIHQNFYNPTEFFPAHTIKKSSKPYRFEKGPNIPLPDFVYEGVQHTAQNYMDSAMVTGFAVAKNDQLVFEAYYNGHSESTTHISWSVAKSFVSLLFGIAIEEGHIKSVNDKVDDYLPQLKGSGYEDVKIVDVLQMSSGVGFNEDYGDFWSDINRWSRGFAIGGSQDAFAATLKRVVEPGTVYDYISLDTHVLGMLIVKTTGKTLSNYMHEKLWQPIGAEFDAQWIVDNEDMEIAFGGLNATLRDYLKFGSLVLNNGEWNGEQIVSKDWLLESRTVKKNHLKNIDDNTNYGYQWWLPVGDGTEMVARGHSGQYIYINFASNTVIAQNSANYLNNDKSHLYSNFPVILAFLRAVNESLVEVAVQDGVGGF